jgi:hypothetical protein
MESLLSAPYFFAPDIKSSQTIYLPWRRHLGEQGVIGLILALPG